MPAVTSPKHALLQDFPWLPGPPLLGKRSSSADHCWRGPGGTFRPPGGREFSAPSRDVGKMSARAQFVASGAASTRRPAAFLRGHPELARAGLGSHGAPPHPSAIFRSQPATHHEGQARATNTRPSPAHARRAVSGRSPASSGDCFRYRHSSRQTSPPVASSLICKQIWFCGNTRCHRSFRATSDEYHRCTNTRTRLYWWSEGGRTPPSKRQYAALDETSRTPAEPSAAQPRSGMLLTRSDGMSDTPP